MFVLICGIAGQTEAQWLFPINPYLGVNPYFLSYYPPFPYYLPPAAIAPYPFSSPLLAPPVPTRVGAATLIITNPTAGTATLTVVNPTVTAPTAVAASPPPLLSLLATLYSSALYEGLLSTANPLLFATLQSLFL
jgi:hypothetical protein